MVGWVVVPFLASAAPPQKPAASPPVVFPARFPSGCDGKSLLLSPLIETKTSAAGVTRALQLKLMFCDGSSLVQVVATTDAAWVFPWWTKENFDPEATAAGAVLSARANGSDAQLTLRVVPRDGFLSILSSSRPWRASRGGAEGVGALEFVEVSRLPVPKGASVTLVKGN
jgi:hypothetical protein